MAGTRRLRKKFRQIAVYADCICAIAQILLRDSLMTAVYADCIYAIAQILLRDSLMTAVYADCWKRASERILRRASATKPEIINPLPKGMRIFSKP